MDMENHKHKQQQQKKKTKNVPFPFDLVEEILLRLPVKSIVRFKSLSKHFLSRTSDPNFTKSNFDLCSSPPTNALLYITDRIVSTYSNNSGWVNLKKPIHHIVKVRPSYLANPAIIGSCRGFILLKIYPSEPHLMLWNPLTGACKTMSYNWHRDLCFGFGYDESSDDYLIVAARKKWVADSNSNEPNLKCFSVRKNSWQDIKIKFDSDLSLTLESKCGVFCNGAIHWIGVRNRCGYVIVALDLKEMSLSEIQMPIVLDVDRVLKVFEGCIALCFGLREIKTISIWEMKDYNKVCPSWTMRYLMISSDDISYYDPMYFNKCGELVAMKNGNYLVKFDEKGRLIEGEAIDDQFRRDYDVDTRTKREIMFPLTLLSLPGHSNNTRNDIDSY